MEYKMTMKDTETISNMNYVFSGATGNLTSRTGMLPQTESFAYDNSDRLTAVRQDNVTTMSMAYHANGNIASKSGLGSYSYDKPHAVSGVDNTGGLIRENDQTITYTAFDKVSSISETAGPDSYLLNITYGPDRQRWKSTLKTNNAVTRTTVYADDYEIITEGGTTKHLYYLGGESGPVAIYVKQSGQTDKVYYAHKDHLGSIVKLTDGAGAEVFSASYDAWGRRTVTNSTFRFHRGYTGHEHLDEFRLIDMNGRMYDPLLARFLSPDPFVQAPESSQNYNRYTYCLNNPLVYTDPTGEFAWFVPVIIGAVVGAYAGASIQSGTAAFWNWKPNAWQGAIAGGLIGATAGGMFSAAFAPGGVAGVTATSSFQATGMITKGAASAAWGTTSTILNSASLNIGMNAISGGGWDGAWKAGLVGVATGGWTASGGFGMVKGFGSSNALAQLGGKLGYQMVGTAGGSIGNNWAAGKNPFSQVSLGLGPVNLTLGKGQKLLQWQNNLGNITTNFFGLANLAIGGKVNFDWKNLSLNYKGGIIDKFYPPNSGGLGFGAHAVIGNSNLGGLYSHELHHLWQSRSLGDMFLLNYGLQGFGAMLMGGSFIKEYNYFEAQAYGELWW